MMLMRACRKALGMEKVENGCGSLD